MAFSLTTSADYYEVDTNANLVFRVRRAGTDTNTTSYGDIMSMVYNGVEYQDQTRGSQINSGFDWLYSTQTSQASVTATTVGTDYIKITVTTTSSLGTLTHYYMAKNGEARIYMATYFTAEPDNLGLVRYIVRIPVNLLPNGNSSTNPVPYDIRNNTGAIEASDIFGKSDGTTRSKHYSNMRLKDWSFIGATGNNVGIWMVRDNQEGGSGGPFYRSLLMQTADTNQEITYIVNYGQVQTEDMRLNVLNSYTLVFTNGATPSTNIDKSWFAQMDLLGYVGTSGRGRVTGVGINGRDSTYSYTVGYANSTAQYWTSAAASNGFYDTGFVMLPGTYTMTIYKNELAVNTRSVVVTAGNTTILNTITINDDPSSATALWRIGNWDGTPAEFMNGDKVTIMHPSDSRMSSWKQTNFAIGSSTASQFPAYQWKDETVSGPIIIKFNLSQPVNCTLRIGITIAYAGARPRIQLNGTVNDTNSGWWSSIPSVSDQPSTRSLTVGSYRGNNTMFTYAIPASVLVAGENTLIIYAVSGSGSSGYLSAGYAFDCIDLLQS